MSDAMTRIEVFAGFYGGIVVFVGIFLWLFMPETKKFDSGRDKPSVGETSNRNTEETWHQLLHFRLDQVCKFSSRIHYIRFTCVMKWLVVVGSLEFHSLDACSSGCPHQYTRASSCWSFLLSSRSLLHMNAACNKNPCSFLPQHFVRTTFLCIFRPNTVVEKTIGSTSWLRPFQLLMKLVVWVLVLMLEKRTLIIITRLRRMVWIPRLSMEERFQ